MKTFAWFTDLGIGVRLSVLFAIVVIALMAVALVGAFGERESLMRQKGDTTRFIVENALSVAHQHQAMVERGELDEEEARSRVLAIFAAQRYGEDDYLWVNDMQPAMVMHPFRPDLEGQDLSGFADHNGVHLFMDMVKVARDSGAGFVPYDWPRPGDTVPIPKISYVALFEPWGWIIGTGIYVDDVAAEFRATLLRAASMLAVILGLLGLACWQIARSITRPVGEAVRVAEAVAAGQLDNRIEVRTREETGRLLGALRRMQDDLRARLEEERRVSAENLRIRQALDHTSTNVMIADTDRRIIYANQAVLGLLGEAEDDVREALPGFSAARVVGGSIDDFHRNPSHQATLLKDLTGAHRAEIRVGRRLMALTMNPIVDEGGTRTGTIVEWRDRTAEAAVEGEIGGIVQAAAEGDLSHRIGEDGKQGFFLTLTRDINRLLEVNQAGIDDVVRVLAALSRGDLTERIERDYRGVFGRMKADANTTVDTLASIVGRIKRSADQIHTAAGEIAAGNNDLSGRTEHQAASLEETASSMEELTSTVRQNADNARQANQLASGAAGVAERGGQVVGDVVQVMGGISQSSRRIADIIGVIDGIAFQTNILALNAAVEAARAGEAGRGFAVVASEVRSLAQRSAEAAKEIKGLIVDSVARVENGSQLVEQAGGTMAEIVGSVKRVTDIMAEIAAASAEQSSGIEQVNQTVTQLDEVTQQNAALVEEASAAARALASEADELADAVALFRLASTGPAPAHAPRRGAAAGASSAEEALLAALA